MTPYVVYDIPDEQWIAAAHRSRSLKSAIEVVGASKYVAWMNLAKRHRPDLVAAMRSELIPHRERAGLPRCSSYECGRPVKARDMCKRHYEIWLVTVDPAEKVQRAKYPSDDEMVSWFEADSSISKVAQRLGITRSSLRNYIEGRPGLAARVKHLRRTPLLLPEEADRRNRQAQANWRAANPDVVRAINRRWGRNQDPSKRRRWNTHNRLRRLEGRPVLTDEQAAQANDYSRIIALDPCAYCGGATASVDHVRPIKSGGTDLWVNFAPACRSCNSQKNDKELLHYLLWRLDSDALRGGGTNPVDPDGR